MPRTRRLRTTAAIHASATATPAATARAIASWTDHVRSAAARIAAPAGPSGGGEGPPAAAGGAAAWWTDHVRGAATRIAPPAVMSEARKRRARKVTSADN